jgi:hypothetical protein
VLAGVFTMQRKELPFAFVPAPFQRAVAWFTPKDHAPESTETF